MSSSTTSTAASASAAAPPISASSAIDLSAYKALDEEFRSASIKIKTLSSATPVNEREVRAQFFQCLGLDPNTLYYHGEIKKLPPAYKSIGKKLFYYFISFF